MKLKNPFAQLFARPVVQPVVSQATITTAGGSLSVMDLLNPKNDEALRAFVILALNRHSPEYTVFVFIRAYRQNPNFSAMGWIFNTFCAGAIVKRRAVYDDGMPELNIDRAGIARIQAEIKIAMTRRRVATPLHGHYTVMDKGGAPPGALDCIIDALTRTSDSSSAFGDIWTEFVSTLKPVGGNAFSVPVPVLDRNERDVAHVRNAVLVGTKMGLTLPGWIRQL